MQLICSACGLNFSVGDDQPDDLTRCPRCGKWLRAPADSKPAIPASNYFEPVIKSPAGEIDFTFPQVAPVDVAPIEPKPRVLKPRNDRRLIAALCITIVVCLLTIVGLLERPELFPSQSVTTDWDRSHRQEIFQLKTSAESLALDGKLKESYDKYQQLLSIVGDRDVTDPLMVQLIVSARTGQDRVFGLMVSTSPPQQPPKVIARNWSTVDHHHPPVVVDTPLQIPPANSVPTRPTEETAASQPSTEPAEASAPQLTPAELEADTAPALPGDGHKPHLEDFTLAESVTDKQIGDAIDKGVRFLGSHFVNGQIDTKLPGAIPANALPRLQKQPDDSAAPPGSDDGTHLGKLTPTPPQPINPQLGKNLQQLAGAYSTPGVDALCAYALLNAGRAMDVPAYRANEPTTIQMLEVLKLYKMAYTYHRSLRAAALAVFNRTQDSKALEDDVRWLQQASMHGGYTYTMPDRQTSDSDWDNSNSQYGLLGVWAGSDAGKAVSRDYWLAVEKHWTGSAIANGTWPYSAGSSSSATMTCAGIASLLVARDRLDTGEILSKLAARQPLNVDINAGLNWLDTADNCMACLHNDGIGFASYGLYGLERVGLASGFKYFGQHDWYSELAKQLVNQQHLNGSWGNDNGLADVGIGNGSEQTLIDTAYTLLFLARGRHPILFNKLRYDGNWNNRPHDVAHLARFVSDRLERPFNWQVVNLHTSWFNWCDSPVLYISGNGTPNFTAADYASLRSFSDAGGLIFTHADGGSTDFHRWVEEMVGKVFPKYELTLVPANHVIYSIVYPLKNPPPKLLSINNGSRLLMIDSPYDLAGGWQQNWQDERRPEFQLGLNIFVYAAGKRNFKNRLASNYIPADPDPPAGTQQVTRLQFYSEWNPEPYAWERFGRYFQWETHEALVTPVVQMADLKPGTTPLAVLSGTVSYDFLPEQIAAARAYVQAGGVLLIDSCGGEAAFTKSVEKTLLPFAFPEAKLVPIAPDHPLLLASRKYADDLTTPLLRTYAIENGGNDLPIQTLQFGKGWVIFSRLDITTGLLGTTSWGIFGFDPLYAQSIVKNAILWAGARGQ